MPEETIVAEGTAKEKKKKRNKQERLFKCSDADFLMHSRVFRQHFLDRQAAFQNFNATWYGPPFADNWLAKIEEGEAFTADHTTLAELGGHKTRLDKSVQELVNIIKKLEFFASQAFISDKEVLHEFKFNQVNHPDYYNLQFIINCEVIYRLAADDYNAPLLAANMPAALPADLKSHITDTLELEIMHEKFKRTRLQRTRLHIKHLNELYEINEDVHNAARVVFYDNQVVRDLFTLDRFK